MFISVSLILILAYSGGVLEKATLINKITLLISLDVQSQRRIQKKKKQNDFMLFIHLFNAIYQSVSTWVAGIAVFISFF